METTRHSAYEVRNGLLLLNGVPLPLGKGLVLLALAKAGWKGAEGSLGADLARRLFEADPRIGMTVRPLSRAG